MEGEYILIAKLRADHRLRVQEGDARMARMLGIKPKRTSQGDGGLGAALREQGGSETLIRSFLDKG